MKISDEVREVCDICACHDELCALADRIDAEMIELPKDADGKPIHVGDTVWGCRSGMKMTIKELRMTDADGWTITTSKGYIPQGSGVTHKIPDSLKDIADDLDEMVDAAGSADDSCEKLASLADRIRKLAEKEDAR